MFKMYKLYWIILYYYKYYRSSRAVMPRHGSQQCSKTEGFYLNELKASCSESLCNSFSSLWLLSHHKHRTNRILPQPWSQNETRHILREAKRLLRWMRASSGERRKDEETEHIRCQNEPPQYLIWCLKLRGRRTDNGSIRPHPYTLISFFSFFL